ncbi:hypothetical protein [Alicyclobacillus fastidiosus]|uniref:4-oxalocrotonate tautomerase n=1 Tax=Alicyclobacillus fastidiosus TaxID=392011 RepID=A0ABV5A9P7_9BACL|nr:hypothetical protein [Alicyclobacillus fastidiosus]WEH10853.1 hypothetical protein PYS47_06455 [Alicyclobacillus fastidiosus]
MKPQPITVEVQGEFTEDHAKAALLMLQKIWDRVAREQGKRLVVVHEEGESNYRNFRASDDGG